MAPVVRPKAERVMKRTEERILRVLNLMMDDVGEDKWQRL